MQDSSSTASALQLLKRHQESIESAFGQVAFESASWLNNEGRIARLTEQQSTALPHAS